MIDTYSTGVSNTGAKRFDEWCKASILKRSRRERRQAPILPIEIEQVRRCANFQLAQYVVAPAPGIAAASVYSDRHIGDKANSHAHTLGLLLGSRKRALCDPLEKRMKQNLVPIVLCEGFDRRAVWVTPLR
jgi:hypothetical protein